MPRSVRLFVEGMTCTMCVKHVTEVLEDMDHVSSVQVLLKKDDLSEVLVSLNDEVTDKELKDAIDEAGYDLVRIER